MNRITTMEMIESLWGVNATYKLSPDDSTVGLTDEVLLKSDPNRLSFLFVNLSPTGMYISPGNNVDSDNGIYVAGNGGSVNFQWDRDFILPTLEWHVIGTAVNSNYYMVEVLTV